MAINPQLLVCAPVLQNYLVDKDTGLPLAAGIVSLYQDNSRTTFKNWYYQTGSPGAYTYLPLANPLTLSAVGTITDPNGNDTLPFYYPFSETDNVTPQPYYIVVTDANGEQQFTRQNFPFEGSASGSTTATPTLNNLIVNGEFWRNLGNVTTTNTTIALLAPSQHDGYTMPDITFNKNATGATEMISFNNFVYGNPATSTPGFPDQPIKNDIAPEYYLNFQCTGTGTETTKYIQIPIQLHVTSLSGVTNCTATIDAMALSGTPQISLAIYQFLGSGVTSPTPIILKTFTLTNNWAKYAVSFTMPSAQGLSPGSKLGIGGDDALFLQINLPVGVSGICNINIAKPGVYLSSTIPTNDFVTYSQISGIIVTPRTGDIRTSIGPNFESGWMPMSDGTIGSANSVATARANNDTWPLFNLLWALFNRFNHGSTNDICQMFTSTGTPIPYGSSAIGDFTANNQLALPQQVSKAVIGTISGTPGAFYAATNDGGGNLLISGISINTNVFFKGQPIAFLTTGTVPGNLSTNQLFYVSDIISSSSMYVATTYANALNSVRIAFVNSGSGTQSLQYAIVGSLTGEAGHTLLVSELAPHTHNYANEPLLTGSAIQAGTGYALTTGTTTSTGSGVAHNTIQPSIYMNRFIKL